MKTFSFAFAMMLSYSIFAQDSITLFRNGKSQYSIWMSHPQDKSVQQAAKKFNHYFAQMCGKALPYSKSPGSKTVSFQLMNPDAQADLDREGFITFTEGGKLIFNSKSGRGLENAVYSFLEKNLDCRYYAHDAKKIPQKNLICLPPLNETENPHFSFRTINYYDAFQNDYARWHKLHNNPREENHWAALSDDWGMWVHTTFDLVPPETYFKEHPEYFSMRNGVRVPDQLCLSNPEVLKLTVESLRRKIQEKPNATYWSVSQEDNYSYCQCPECHHTDSIEGSHSGSLIRFTNAVASEFPHKIISTLAHQYSRKAPAITTPLPNVNIMLCTIECGRAEPIEKDQSAGSFASDLSAWSRISSNILVWDYVINFHHLTSPFPNFHVLADNIKLFRNNGVKMLFEQGYPGKAGEFNALRCYMLAKLMWNPNASPDSLMNDFTNGYYGAAAPYIREYIMLMTQKLDRKKGLYIYGPPANNASDYLSPENLKQYFKILAQAMEAVKGDTLLERRVNIATQPLRYAALEVAKSLTFSDDWLFEKTIDGNYKVREYYVSLLHEFVNVARLSGLRLLHETKGSPQDYKTEMLNYFENGVVKHKAIGKLMTSDPPCDPRYACTPNCLNDGVHGTHEYRMLWQGWYGLDFQITLDMLQPTSVSSVKASFLDDNQSWILLPAGIEIEISNDNKAWLNIGRYENPEHGNKINKQIRTFQLDFQNTSARYVRLKIKGVGDLPAWRGEKGKAWVFIDEIEIH